LAREYALLNEPVVLLPGRYKRCATVPVVCVDRLKASESGDYSFCFDNSFSQFSSKVVYFDLYIASDDDDDSDSDAVFANLPDYADYEINLEHVKVTKPSLLKASS